MITCRCCSSTASLLRTFVDAEPSLMGVLLVYATDFRIIAAKLRNEIAIEA